MKPKYKVTYSQDGQRKTAVMTEVQRDKLIESFQWRKGFRFHSWALIDNVDPEKSRQKCIAFYRE